MSKTRKKIALIGAGQIGGTLALLSATRGLGDVVLFDIVEGMPQGKALDLCHLGPVFGCDFNIKGTNSLSDIKDADVCIVTSGVPRKPGMSRDDLVKTNADVIRTIAKGIREYAPSSFVVVITNPLDAMAYLMQQETGFKPEMVLGMAGVLDSARYRAHLAEALNVSVASVSAFVLGGHGDTMVPVRSYTSCGGVPVSQLLDDATLTQIENRVRNSGGEVVSLLKTGSAFYSPAASALEMVESYLYDQKKLLPAAAKCTGQYGINGIYLGVPTIIGANGLERIVEIELGADEKKLLDTSAAAVQSLIEIL